MASKLGNVIALTYEGSLARGGWEATLRIGADGDALDDWQTVRIWHRDKWNGYDEGWKRVMKGYALPKEISRDWWRGDFDVVVATSHRMLRNMECQYIAFLQDATPANEHEMATLTLGAMIKHILDSHTNIIFHATNNPEGWAHYSNVDTSVGGTFDWFGFGMERGLVRIWPTIASFADAYGLITYFSKDDNLFWGPHPMFDSPAPDKVVTLTTDFWTSIRILKRKQEQAVRQAIITGDKDDGTTLIGTYPDLTAGTDWYYGHDEFGRVRCNDQTELDSIAERKQRFMNREYDVVLETWGLWDLEMGDRVGITYANAADGIDWSDKDFYVQSVQVTIDLKDPKRKGKKGKIVLNEGV